MRPIILWKGGGLAEISQDTQKREEELQVESPTIEIV